MKPFGSDISHRTFIAAPPDRVYETITTAEARQKILECATGWGEALTLLRFYLEKGVVVEPPRRE